MAGTATRTRALDKDRAKLNESNNGSGPVVPPTDDAQLEGVHADDVIMAKLQALGLGHITPAQYTAPVMTRAKKAGRRATILAGNELVDVFLAKTLAEIERQCNALDSGDEKIKPRGAMFAATNKEYAAFKRFLNPTKGNGWLDEQETETYTVELSWSMADIPGLVAASSNPEDADDAVIYVGHPTVVLKEIPADEDDNSGDE